MVLNLELQVFNTIFLFIIRFTHIEGFVYDKIAKEIPEFDK